MFKIASENVWKLANRLENEFNMIVDVETFCRTRVGRHLMCSGAFSWGVQIKEFNGNKIRGWLGGYEPLSKYIVKKHKLQLNSYDLFNCELYYLPISNREYDYAMEKSFEVINSYLN